MEAIGQHATTNGQWCRTTQSAHEAERHQLARVLGKATGQVPSEIEQIGQLQNEDAPVYFRQRSKEERPDGVCQNEYREGELSLDLVCDVEIFTDGDQRWRNDRR